MEIVYQWSEERRTLISHVQLKRRDEGEKRGKRDAVDLHSGRYAIKRVYVVKNLGRQKERNAERVDIPR